MNAWAAKALRQKTQELSLCYLPTLTLATKLVPAQKTMSVVSLMQVGNFSYLNLRIIIPPSTFKYEDDTIDSCRYVLRKLSSNIPETSEISETSKTPETCPETPQTPGGTHFQVITWKYIWTKGDVGWKKKSKNQKKTKNGVI